MERAPAQSRQWRRGRALQRGRIDCERRPVATRWRPRTWGRRPVRIQASATRKCGRILDFAPRTLMTVAAKQVVQAYYGKEPAYSYFNGGSTGGQQALAGSAALSRRLRWHRGDDSRRTGRIPLHAYFLWNYQILAKCPFTKSQDDNVVAAGQGIHGQPRDSARGRASSFPTRVAPARTSRPSLRSP